MLLLGGLYQLPLAIHQLPAQSWTGLSGESILFVALSAVFSLYTGYTLFYYAISRIGPARAGIYSNLTLVFTLALASRIRGAAILPRHIIGLAGIVAGLANTKTKWRSSAPGPREEN